MIPQPLRDGLYVLPRLEPLAGAAAAAHQPLNVNIEHQEASKWCWAAVTAGIANYRRLPGAPWKQCEVAKKRWNHQDCCTVPTPGVCNDRTELNVAFACCGLQSTNANGWLTFSDIREEIDAGNPLAACIRFGSDVFHFVEIDGYRTSDRYVFVNCSERGSLTMSHGDLVTNFNNEGGAWYWWYRTR